MKEAAGVGLPAMNETNTCLTLLGNVIYRAFT